MNSFPVRKQNPRGSGPQLRAEILEAAAELLDLSGTEKDVTLRAVARRVGITPTSIYRHFADRDALLMALVDEAYETFEARLREARVHGGSHPVAQLHAMCGKYLEFAEHEGQRYRLMFGGMHDVSATAKNLCDTDALVDRNVAMASFDLLAETVQACAQAAGLTDSDFFADAAVLWVGLHGFALLRSSNPAFPWPDDLVLQLQERLPGVGRTRASSGAV